MSSYCQKCQAAMAVVHVTELEGGKPVELHLCAECAEGQGFTQKASPAVSMLEIFQQLVEKSGSFRVTKDTTCPKCKMSFSEFKAKGRFGCAEDYDAFASKLLPLLQRIHGATEHRFEEGEARPEGAPVLTLESAAAGEPAESVPPPGPASAEPASKKHDLEHELDRLRSELKRMIHEEAYEEAARVRDRIRDLEESLGGEEAP